MIADQVRLGFRADRRFFKALANCGLLRHDVFVQSKDARSFRGACNGRGSESANLGA
jgi:hypothetical protein